MATGALIGSSLIGAAGQRKARKQAKQQGGMLLSEAGKRDPLSSLGYRTDFADKLAGIYGMDTSAHKAATDKLSSLENRLSSLGVRGSAAEALMKDPSSLALGVLPGLGSFRGRTRKKKNKKRLAAIEATRKEIADVQGQIKGFEESRQRPEDILKSLPGYTAGLNLATQGLRRQASRSGKTDSGNILAELQQLGTAQAGSAIDRLAYLSGAGNAGVSGQMVSQGIQAPSAAPQPGAGLGSVLGAVGGAFSGGGAGGGTGEAAWWQQGRGA